MRCFVFPLLHPDSTLTPERLIDFVLTLEFLFVIVRSFFAKQNAAISSQKKKSGNIIHT